MAARTSASRIATLDASNGNGHTDSVVSQAVAAQAQANSTSGSTPPANMSATEQAMFYARRSGKSKPTVKYTKPQADNTGFVASPSLTVRVKGWSADAIATELEAHGQKAVGSLSHKEADAPATGQWVKSEGSIVGVDMAPALRALQAGGVIR